MAMRRRRYLGVLFDQKAPTLGSKPILEDAIDAILKSHFFGNTASWRLKVKERCLVRKLCQSRLCLFSRSITKMMLRLWIDVA